MAGIGAWWGTGRGKDWFDQVELGLLCSLLSFSSLASRSTGSGVDKGPAGCFRVGLRSWEGLGLLLLLERRDKAVNGRSVTTYVAKKLHSDFFFALRLKMTSLGCNGKRSQNGH
jgi:hypothetical protein